ncbi:MAG TPA: hypothetical protein VFC46_17940, partial [Humisphaera sp.]|nr:hypothetical protein [Humisphaera sp.]
MRHPIVPENLFMTRRQMLGKCGMGMGAVMLGGLLGESSSRAAEVHAANPLIPKFPQFAGKA